MGDRFDYVTRRGAVGGVRYQLTKALGDGDGDAALAGRLKAGDFDVIATADAGGNVFRSISCKKIVEKKRKKSVADDDEAWGGDDDVGEKKAKAMRRKKTSAEEKAEAKRKREETARRKAEVVIVSSVLGSDALPELIKGKK